MSHFEYDSPDIFDIIRSLHFDDLEATYIPYRLHFKRPAKTSRDTLQYRDVWYIKVSEKHRPDVIGWGECAPLPGLSIETPSQITKALPDFCRSVNQYPDLLSGKLDHLPSLNFALEQALIDLSKGGKRILFPSKFTDGKEQITINGLVWMGSPQYMIDQINEKIHQGFKTIKLKIGGIDFRDEIAILQELRNTFGYDDIEIRLDANGAFDVDDALNKMETLADFHIHSIEQPIRAGQWEEMAELCRYSPIPIALDEELIGLTDREEKQELLEAILPSYIILKPSLLGGFQHCADWIEVAESINTGWWATSALESNIGLNAIAQWVFTLQNPIPQGLGTGQLYENNPDSPLVIQRDSLMYANDQNWDLEII